MLNFRVIIDNNNFAKYDIYVEYFNDYGKSDGEYRN